MAKYKKNPEFKGEVVLPDAVKPLSDRKVVRGDYAALVAEGKLVEVAPKAHVARVARVVKHPERTVAGRIAAGLLKPRLSKEEGLAKKAARVAKRAVSYAASSLAAKKAATLAKLTANRAASAAKREALAAKAAAKAAKAPKAPVAAQ